MVEHTTHNRCVAGSIPAIATGIFPITSSLVLTGSRSAKVKAAVSSGFIFGSLFFYQHPLGAWRNW